MKRRSILALTLTLLSSGGALAQVKLEPRVEDVTTHKKTTQKFSQKLTIAGMAIETTSEQAVTSRNQAGRRSADGSVRATMQTRSLVVRVGLPGNQTIEFDSDKPDKKTGNPQVDQVIEVSRALSGASVTLVLDRANQVVKVEGAEAVIQKAPDSTQDALRKAYSPERLGRQVRQELSALPDKPVKAGDTWARVEVMEIGGGQTLTFDVNYEYAGTEQRNGKSLDRVKLLLTSVKYGVEPGSQLPAQVSSSNLRIESTSGHYLFDRERGIVVERRMEAQVKGPLTLSVNGMELPAELDLALETGTTEQP